MKLLLDEMMDQRLCRQFSSGGHLCSTVQESELTGLLSGQLLAAADLRGFDVLITTDKNIQYQNNLAGKKISLFKLLYDSEPYFSLRAAPSVSFRIYSY